MINLQCQLDNLLGSWKECGYELKETGNYAILYCKDEKIGCFAIAAILNKTTIQDACQEHWDNIVERFK
jgi:hypothetical protein